jgi:molybdate transport system substrate-binding protein
VKRVGVGLVLAAVVGAVSAQDSAPLTVYAAGSLRAAMTRIGADFEAAPGGQKVNFVFGASGLLRDRLLGGERADVFASANMEHPQALATAGRAQSVRPFTRNALCALAAPGFKLKGRPLAQRLLDADVKVGTSTPKADPSGDYAFEMFDKIEKTGAAPAGSADKLKGASPAGQRFADFVLGAAGQQRLASFGFSSPD